MKDYIKSDGTLYGICSLSVLDNNTEDFYSQGWVDYSPEIVEGLTNKTMCWENGKVVPHTKTQDEIDQENAELKEAKLNELRTKRQSVLKAFDIYKSNLYYGLITETEEEHSEIVIWYNKLLDLDENAINNVPEKVAKYIW